MLKADAAQSRQLPEAGPLLLWRDAAAGGREGLVLLAQACANPKCDCRDVLVEGWYVDDRLLAVEEKGEDLQFYFAAPMRAAERSVILASVNVESGALKPVPKDTEAFAAEWLRRALDANLLAALKQRFHAAKLPESRPPFDWRKEDWTSWKPGTSVAWRDFYADDDRAADLNLDGAVYVLGDTYCAVVGCECEEVEVAVWREDQSTNDLLDLGRVTVAPSRLDGAQIHAHGPDRALVQRIWKAWCSAHPVEGLLRARSAEVRRLAPELDAHVARTRKQRGGAGKVGPNQPCPCGSGKKHKKCCMRG
jgi:hypothetical protein